MSVVRAILPDMLNAEERIRAFQSQADYNRRKAAEHRAAAGYHAVLASNYEARATHLALDLQLSIDEDA